MTRAQHRRDVRTQSQATARTTCGLLRLPNEINNQIFKHLSEVPGRCVHVILARSGAAKCYYEDFTDYDEMMNRILSFLEHDQPLPLDLQAYLDTVEKAFAVNGALHYFAGGSLLIPVFARPAIVKTCSLTLDNWGLLAFALNRWSFDDGPALMTFLADLKEEHKAALRDVIVNVKRRSDAHYLKRLPQCCNLRSIFIIVPHAVYVRTPSYKTWAGLRDLPRLLQLRQLESFVIRCAPSLIPCRCLPCNIHERPDLAMQWS